MLIERFNKNTDHFAVLVSMLKAAQLPVDDLNDASISLYGCIDDGFVCGGVGLQALGDIALLRSLVIAPDHRGRGLGGALAAFAKSEAMAQKFDALYLLTDTAEQFFAQQGYTHLSRKMAPLAIRQTAQFSALCPDSAQLMCIQLASTPDN